MLKKKKNEEEVEEINQESSLEDDVTMPNQDQEEFKEKEITAEDQAAEYLNDLKRLQADFENYKRRQAELQKGMSGFLIEKLVLELIPVLDNFRSANEHIPEASKSEPWVVGVQYIEKQLEDVLTSNGMQTIEVHEGDAFDPNIHEAVSQAEPVVGEGVENSQEIQQQKVAKVLQKGYKLGEKIVRPAKVIVS